MRSLYDKLRDSAHTGERRCWPCTTVNAAILLLASRLIHRRSRSLGVALGVVGGSAIALRGYLVPYTPRFAPRLVSSLPGDPFHSGTDTPVTAAPDASGSVSDASEALGDDGDETAGERVLRALLESGVVVAEDETLYLDGDFRATWRSEMRELRNEEDEALAAALRANAPEGAVVDVVEPGGDRWFVVSDGSDDPARESWLSRPVAVAETAAIRALADRTDLGSGPRGSSTETEERSASAIRRAQAASPLRTFLESCPVCDGAVEKTTAVECCGGPGGTRPDAPDEVLACTDCDARLYTFQ